jgi:hypothetical protein
MLSIEISSCLSVDCLKVLNFLTVFVLVSFGNLKVQTFWDYFKTSVNVCQSPQHNEAEDSSLYLFVYEYL